MRGLAFAASFLVFVAPLSAQEAVDYLRDIKPVFKERCFACHGVLKQNAKLRVDTVELMRRGGKRGAVIVAGQPDKSVLLERLSANEDSERMPPEGKPLTPMQLALVRKWIAQGAPAPANEEPETDPRAHWAFKPPVRPSLPAV